MHFNQIPFKSQIFAKTLMHILLEMQRKIFKNAELNKVLKSPICHNPLLQYKILKNAKQGHLIQLENDRTGLCQVSGNLSLSLLLASTPLKKKKRSGRTPTVRSSIPTSAAQNCSSFTTGNRLVLSAVSQG